MTSLITTPFSAESSAAEVVDGIDLAGRRVIVTGGASGIGVETARALAGAGAEVTLAVRNPAAGERTAEALVFAMGWHRYLSLETLVRHRAAIDGFVHAHCALAVAAFIGIYVAVVALSIPGAAILTVAGGVLFGWLVGGLAAIVGATIGATVVFLIARSACGEVLLRRAGTLVAKVAQGFRDDAFNYLLFLRLVPAFPFWLVNLAPALVGISLGTFVLATALGIIPGSFAYALVGEGLDSVIAAQESAYRACLAAGTSGCRLAFSLSAVATPQLLAAFAALGLVALIPVAVRKWRARTAAGAPS